MAKNPLNNIQHTLSGLARVFTSLDTILAGTPVRVSIDERTAPPAPAWSAGDDIYFSGASITDADIESLVQLQGLNYHELAHVLYTPANPHGRFGREHLPAFNILEDNRIEALLTARWPSAADYLTATVSRWILSEGDLSNALPLIRGRQYLPLEVRQAARRAYRDQSKVEAICAVIDEYRTLSLPTDWSRAVPLIKRFTELLGGNPPENSCSTTEGQANIHRDPNQEPVPAGCDDPADGEGDEQTPSDSDERARELKEALDAALEDVHSNETVVKETTRTRQQARNGNTHHKDETRPDRRGSRELSSRAIISARRFEDELRELAADAEAGWDRRTSSGRLNLDRYIAGADPEEAFDRWDEGADGYDLEVAVLMDASGSMNGRVVMEALDEAAWAIDRAVKAIDGGCRVYAFSNYCSLVYPAHEKSPARAHRLTIGGGTQPLDALQRAEDIMSTSKRANKLVIVVTDGDWGDSDHSEEVIARIQARGATVAVAYLHTNPYYVPDPEDAEGRYRHGAAFFKEIHTAADLPKWGRDIVKHVTKSRTAR